MPSAPTPIGKCLPGGIRSQSTVGMRTRACPVNFGVDNQMVQTSLGPTPALAPRQSGAKCVAT